MVGQSHRHSVIEALTNAGGGFVMAFGINVVVMHYFAPELNISDSFWITMIFSAVTFVRLYAFRRLFNWWHVKVVDK